MTKEELVTASGIEEAPEFREWDTALPMNRIKGTYPFGGKAISVYFSAETFPRIYSLVKLAKMAVERKEKLDRSTIARHWDKLVELSKLEEVNLEEGAIL